MGFPILVRQYLYFESGPRCFTNLLRLISAAISQWVTSDPAELPFYTGRKTLCTSAVEYNPKGKHTSFSQIYHQNPAHLCVPYVWFPWKLCPSKMASVTNRLQKDEQWQLLLLGDWCLWREDTRCRHKWVHEPFGRTSSLDLTPSGTSPLGEVCFLTTQQREFLLLCDLPPE